MKFYLLLCLALLSACSNSPSTLPNTDKPVAEPNETASRDTDKVYYLQHQLLPSWTFNSNGEFFADLIHGDNAFLLQTASELVSEQYAQQISTKVLSHGAAVLITFPTPIGLPNCYFILIVKSDDDFSFYTYEKTFNFSGDEQFVGVVGAWDKEGRHGNFGPRMYTSAQDFVKDVFELRHK